ncbi:MAG: hypothetical protein LBO03_01590 [Acidaminococcales bacterium]|nr:hypothetical protein [Acidaminococcales bacterium]
MKKKLFLLFLAIAAAAPVCYASFFSFAGPAVTLSLTKGLGYGKPPNREAYKPYPAPRGEVPVSRYALERKKHFDAVSASFQSISEEYGNALKCADLAAKDFDAMRAGGF